VQGDRSIFLEKTFEFFPNRRSRATLAVGAHFARTRIRAPSMPAPVFSTAFSAGSVSFQKNTPFTFVQ
jgi:hypothetical protein